VSNAVKEYLICIQEINNEKAVVIYNPVSAIKTKLKKLPNEFTLISIGRLEKVKNHVLLIKSLYKLRNKNTKLILVGEGSERKNLENLVNKLNLQDRVTFTGFVQNPEKYIARAHLFVLPSLSEGFGIAVVEAMQQNIACMCSNIGGIPEFITHKETGWLFDPNNEKELVNQLNEIIAMPSNDIEKIANNAKMSVEDRFTIEKYVKILENLYCKNHD
jgi:glycosyltransferase involved in cell wall biosynthesis